MLGDNQFLQFVDSPGFWVVTAHELVSEVDRNQDRFSSYVLGVVKSPAFRMSRLETRN